MVDGDLLAMDPHDIPNLRVHMTVLGGRIVFESDGSGTAPLPTVAGPVVGHYGPSTRLVMRPDACGCGYDAMVLVPDR